MTTKFTIPLGAFSINKMQTRDARFKTVAYKEYATKVLWHLSQVEDLQKMSKEWHLSSNRNFHIQFVFNYPGYVFYNKQGTISSKTVDLSNCSKPLLDLIFDDTMNINDKFVVSLKEEKRASDVYSIEVTLIML